MPEPLWTVVQNSTTARDAVRGLAIASTCRELPLPVVSEVLESLAGMGHGLPKVIENLQESLIFFLAAEYPLEVSLGVGRLEVTGGHDPRESVALAQAHFHLAASLAVQLGNELSKAKEAMSTLDSEESWS